MEIMEMNLADSDAGYKEDEEGGMWESNEDECG